MASNEDVANFGPYHVYYVHSLGYTWDKWVSEFCIVRTVVGTASEAHTFGLVTSASTASRSAATRMWEYLSSIPLRPSLWRRVPQIVRRH